MIKFLIRRLNPRKIPYENIHKLPHINSKPAR